MHITIKAHVKAEPVRRIKGHFPTCKHNYMHEC